MWIYVRADKHRSEKRRKVHEHTSTFTCRNGVRKIPNFFGLKNNMWLFLFKLRKHPANTCKTACVVTFSGEFLAPREAVGACVIASAAAVGG